jgi:TolB-like protein
MSSARTLLTGLGMLLLPSIVGAQETTPAADTASTANHTIAVADFTGSDPELGRFIAETLLTDLAQSSKLHFAERSEIRHALEELKLQSTGLVEPQQIKQLGSLVSADRIIVGSYFVLDDQIIINARLLDVESGKLMEGGAGNVTGERGHLLSIVHRLAHQFHRRVTGNDYVIDNEGAEPTSARSGTQNNSGKAASASAPGSYRPLRSSGQAATPQTVPPSDNSGYRVQEKTPGQPQPDPTPVDLTSYQTPSDQTPSNPPPLSTYQPIVIQEASIIYPVNYPDPSRPVFTLGYPSNYRVNRSVSPYRVRFIRPRVFSPHVTVRRPLR